MRSSPRARSALACATSASGGFGHAATSSGARVDGTRVATRRKTTDAGRITTCSARSCVSVLSHVPALARLTFSPRHDRLSAREMATDGEKGKVEYEDVDEEPRSRLNPLATVIVVVVITVGGWFLVQRLMAASKLQDCQMQGRHNCVAPE